MIKKSLIMLLVFLLGLGIYYRELIGYGLMQGEGQLRVLLEASPIEEYLVDEQYPDSLKHKLRLIQQVRDFGFQELGIFENQNYTKMYDQGGKPTLWVVSACEAFQLKPVEWSFPLVGTFPYKGFFDLEKAKKEEAVMQERGKDTSIRTVSAWSTLGWFSDPVMSNFLNNGDGELAELILHELTHGTLFVKDSVQFNENLATFIGHQGAVLFLEKQYGRDSEEYREYANQWKDERKFVNYMLGGAKKLNALYEGFPEDLSKGEKQRQKDLMIEDICQQLDTVNFSEGSHFHGLFRKRRPNNAYFMSFVRYREYYDELENELQQQYQGSVKRLLEDYKQRYPSM